MQVGVNALGQIRGGTLEHLRQLLCRWAGSIAGSDDTLTLFASNGTLRRLGCIPCGVQVIPVVLGDWGGIFRLLGEQLLLPWLIWHHAIDVLFSPASTMPAFSGAPCVVILQNTAPFLSEPELRKFGFSVRFRMIVLRCFINISLKRATAIIFLSQTFKSFIGAGIRNPRANDIVLYHARPQVANVNKEELQTLTRTLGITQPYLLCVSHIYPYKNLIELVSAFGLLDTAAVQLVLVGHAISQKKYLTEVRKAAEDNSQFPGQILLTGGLPHEQVQLLLKGCLSFVFPSTCETCPVGLIEALAFRVPIACSDVGAMPEIAGHAALLFDPYRPDRIAAVLRTMIMESEVRAELASRSEHELLRFGTPAAVADATWQVISRVAHAIE